MKILLTGCTGQVGWELQRQLGALGELVAPGRTTLDLTQPESVAAAVRRLRPDLIVNAAAYTAVDRAETDAQACFTVNTDAVGVLAEEAMRSGALLVHYSTDYVFDGRKREPYREVDPTAPIGVYGRSKLAGEQRIVDSGCRHLILRTSWVYAGRGSNFMLTMLRLGREKPELRVVNDQMGAPTWAHDIARATLAALGGGAPAQGLFHVASGGATTWYDFASLIVRSAGLSTTVTPIATRDYPTAAARPAFSVLDSSRFESATGFRVGPWQERLVECMRRDGLLAVQGA